MVHGAQDAQARKTAGSIPKSIAAPFDGQVEMPLAQRRGSRQAVASGAGRPLAYGIRDAWPTEGPGSPRDRATGPSMFTSF